MVEEREMAREKKDWKKADELRKELNKAGYEITDTEKGTKIKKTPIDN